MNRLDIEKIAHKGEVKPLVREYFKDTGKHINNIKKEDVTSLIGLINKRIDFFLEDKSYHMIDKLKVNNKLETNDWKIQLTVKGFYFDKREAITFWIKEDKIGFCGWADGCNQTPFILGFLDWCDKIRRFVKDEKTN